MDFVVWLGIWLQKWFCRILLCVEVSVGDIYKISKCNYEVAFSRVEAEL